MSQIISTIESGVAIPPFRSATDFPMKPKQERLPQLYPEILQELQNANVARSILRASLEMKKQMIVEVSAEIDRIENDLALEAETRLRLHAMNEQFVKALQEIEGVADGVSDVVVNAHQTTRTSLRALVQSLKDLVKSWRSLKLQFRSGLVPPESGSNNDV